MKVYTVADIINNVVEFRAARGWQPGDVAAILTNCKPANEPRPNSTWQMECKIKLINGNTKTIMLDLKPLLSVNDSLESPLFLDDRLVFYRDQLFLPERPPRNATDREEIVLRVKKAIYNEEAELASLRAAVANLEAAIEYSKSGPKREAIPEDVKLVVWTRDGGACVRCGSKQKLHFDHIIPLAKGGGNSEANIQILCQTCNLKKADNISTM